VTPGHQYASTIGTLSEKVDKLDSRLTTIQGTSEGLSQAALAQAAKTQVRILLMGLVISAVVIIVNIAVYSCLYMLVAIQRAGQGLR
jgi:hypothetical protein